MVGVVGVVLKDEGAVLDDGMAFLTDVLPQTSSLLTVMTGSTQVPG